MPYVITIEPGGADRFDSALVGGKACQLSLAGGEGFPIPKSLVLTTEVFPGKAWLQQLADKAPTEQGTETRSYLQGLDVHLTSALSSLGQGRFAVRSSATSEDMETASFAGSFRTKLNVPEDDVFRAVYDVWASTFSKRVKQYMDDRGLSDDFAGLKMAVMIQSMIAPRLSGVALSHPLGKPDTPYISVGVVEGLGEPLVSGVVDPQTFLLERGTWTVVEYQDASAVDVIYEMAGQIGRTVMSLELSRGVPQDVEFAIDRDMRFVLLQNRPIVSGRG